MKTTELKLLLNCKKGLRDGYGLSEDVKTKFGVTKPGEHMKIWYLDTTDQKLDSEGWLVRYRYHEGCNFELTFKKRYKEAEFRSLSDEVIKAFKGFEPEIDMGYSKKTYSFSYIKLFKLNDKLYNLKPDKARALAVKNCPDILADNGSGKDGRVLLQSTALYGPVEALEYKGEYEGLKATFEIWKLGGYLPELSFEIETARSGDFLKKLVAGDKKRLILHKDLLKTKALFNYYSKHTGLLKH